MARLERLLQPLHCRFKSAGAIIASPQNQQVPGAVRILPDRMFGQSQGRLEIANGIGYQQAVPSHTVGYQRTGSLTEPPEHGPATSAILVEVTELEK